jgi:hypothetical protein
MMAGRTRGSAGGTVSARVPANAGMNRFVWNVQHQNGLPAPPGAYQARLTVGTTKLVQPFTLLVDPRLAEEGLTAADLQEQFDHNVKARQLVADVNQLLQRVGEAKKTLAGKPSLKQVEEVELAIRTEPVRYGKPGLQQHSSYLASMTGAADQKVGRDAIDRYNVLKKELDALTAQLNAAIKAGG